MCNVPVHKYVKRVCVKISYGEMVFTPQECSGCIDTNVTIIHQVVNYEGTLCLSSERAV